MTESNARTESFADAVVAPPPLTAPHNEPHLNASEPLRDVSEAPLTPWGRAVHCAAFTLSAVLSPYLVIPGGTVGIVASQTPSAPNAYNKLWLWTLLSVFFSTCVPALFVVVQIWRGKITDVHVMEREQRGEPFLVAILSSAVGAWVLKSVEAPSQVWSVGVVLSINGIVMLGITNFWKISIHVSVLSATILTSIMLIPGLSPWLLILIPALIWARITRGRHSVWQGIGGCAVASLVTWLVFFSLRTLYSGH